LALGVARMRLKDTWEGAFDEWVKEGGSTQKKPQVASYGQI